MRLSTSLRQNSPEYLSGRRVARIVHGVDCVVHGTARIILAPQSTCLFQNASALIDLVILAGRLRGEHDAAVAFHRRSMYASRTEPAHAANRVLLSNVIEPIRFVRDRDGLGFRFIGKPDRSYVLEMAAMIDA